MTETRLHYEVVLSANTIAEAVERVESTFNEDYGDTPLEIVRVSTTKLAPGKWEVKIRAESDPDYPESDS